MTQKHVFKIPILESGEPDLDNLEKGHFNFLPPGLAKKEKWNLANDKPPFSHLHDVQSNMVNVHQITIVSTTGSYCYWTISGGVLVRK